MDNPVIQSILEEEAQAELELAAAREQAQALIRETQEKIKQDKKKAEEEAAAHLEASRREADELAARLSRKADEVSAKIDLCMITSHVEYEPPFDVNDSFGEAFEAFLSKAGA